MAMNCRCELLHGGRLELKAKPVHQALHRAGKVGAERLVADLAIALAQHAAIGAALLHAVHPVKRVEEMTRALITRLGQGETSPMLDSRRIEIDLSPELLFGRHMVRPG